MGLFGIISESITNLQNAIGQLVYHPLHDENYVKGVAVGGFLFLRLSFSTITSSLYSFKELISNNLNYLRFEIFSSKKGKAGGGGELSDDEDEDFMIGVEGAAAGG